MHPIQADKIADAVLDQARHAAASKQTRTSLRAQAFVRLRTGFITLVGFYLGWRIGTFLFGQMLPAAIVGFVLGLTAAVVFPRRQA